MIWPMPLDPSRIELVLFDVDGTLRDTDDEIVSKLARLFRRPLGEERSHEAMRKLVMALESPLQVMLGLADRLGVDGPLNRLIDYLAPHGATHLVPGTAEMVAELRGRVRMGVVSAGPKRGVDRFLAEHRLTDVMEIVVTGQTFERTKPNAMPVLRAASELGVAPDAVLMVGDTTVDIKAGRRAGAQTLGVTSGFGRPRDLEHACADEIAPSVAALVHLLAG